MAKSLEKLHAMESFGIVHDPIHKIRVTRLEDRLIPKVPFPHKHNFYFLMFISKGNGEHEIDFRNYKAHTGAIYFMEPSQVHSWKLTNKTTGIIIEFQNLDIFSDQGELSYIESIIQKIPNYQRAKENLKIKSLFENAITEYENKNVFFENKIRALLTYILLDITQESTDENNHKHNDFLKKFLHYLEVNYAQSGELSFYAKKMKCQEKSLSEKLKRLTGKSFRTLYQDRMILEARRLLAYSNYTIAEIAFKLGFLDLNYFSRLFKKTTKKTPSEFRSINRQKECC